MAVQCARHVPEERNGIAASAAPQLSMPMTSALLGIRPEAKIAIEYAATSEVKRWAYSRALSWGRMKSFRR
jgi:hypothetical protein